MKINKLHLLSGLTITVFVGVHLLNHIMSIMGAEAHIKFMNSTRVIYRNSIVETLLLLAVLVQIVTGVKLFFSVKKAAKDFYRKLQIWSGLYLAFFLLFHVSAVFVGRFVLDLDTNFYFGVAGLNTFPFYIFFVPYYGMAIISFFGHIASIHHRKMTKTPFGISVKQQSQFILMLGISITLVIFFGLTNGFTGVEIPEAYDVMIGK